MIVSLYMLLNFQRSTKAIFLLPKYMQTLLECKKLFRQPWKKYFEKDSPPFTFNVEKVAEVGTWSKNACLSRHCARGMGHFWNVLNLREILKYFFHHCSICCTPLSFFITLLNHFIKCLCTLAAYRFISVSWGLF